jgi:hypothetical protein
VQKAFGYSLTGSTAEKIVFMCLGRGDNGKTTLLPLFLRLLKEYAVLLQIDTWMVRQESNNMQADLADLRGARFVMTSETQQGQRLAEGKLKRITQDGWNGFVYVLDRVTGDLLLAKSFLRCVDWASEISADGRPQVKDPAGCPDDAANWGSTAYSPVTGLYYFMALEECVGQKMGYPDQTGQRYLRAVNADPEEDDTIFGDGQTAVQKRHVSATPLSTLKLSYTLCGSALADQPAISRCWTTGRKERQRL